MKDAPSIVPDPLANLIALIDQYATASDEWIMENLLTQLREAERAAPPESKLLFHVAIEGAVYVRRQSDSARRSNGRNLTRNITLALECVRRRRDPAYEDFSDSRLMALVGDQMAALERSAAIECIRSVLSHHTVTQSICESGKRRNPDGRRSIFDGSKKVRT